MFLDRARRYLRCGYAQVFWSAGAFILVTLAMLWPTFWNGYPLVYFDSQDYVDMSFVGNVVIWRTMPYATFLIAAQPFGTLFSIVIIQSTIVAWFIHESVVAFIPSRQQWIFLGLSVGLAIFTGLPWVSSEILADVFSGLVACGVAVLAYGERLSLFRRALLVLLTAIAIATHMSHVAVASGLLVCLIVLWACPRKWTWVARPRLSLVTPAVVAGVVLVPLNHKIATGEAFFSRAGRVLQLALLIQDGLAQRYLETVCPEGASLVLCPYRNQFPTTADAFLWAHWASPIDEIGGWASLKPDADIIVPNTLMMFPLDTAKAATMNTIWQLTSLSLGDGLVPMGSDTYLPFRALYKWYPTDVPRFEGARQQQADLDLTGLDEIQQPLALIAQFLLPALCVIAWRRRDNNGAGMALVMCLALLGNAFVCGALSNPHDRYQNRLVWVAVLASVILPVRWYQLSNGRALVVSREESAQERAV